ncbi:hypothetical protein ILYODFUR_010265 [Ilyodon furcidens]|uniref:Uncharacterized protein n=1 Tax=Ilyodon furcidens TaxID=33524 RepID=A0ABV0SK10_9TELE
MLGASSSSPLFSPMFHCFVGTQSLHPRRRGHLKKSVFSLFQFLFLKIKSLDLACYHFPPSCTCVEAFMCRVYKRADWTELYCRRIEMMQWFIQCMKLNICKGRKEMHLPQNHR